MKITSAAQIAARHSSAVRHMSQAPVARAVELFTEPQIGALHHRAGNTVTAGSILASLRKTEAEGYRLCNILRDIKVTCLETLGMAH